MTEIGSRDDALAEVERLRAEWHRDGHTKQWLHDKIEELNFFSESEIWELLEW